MKTKVPAFIFLLLLLLVSAVSPSIVVADHHRDGLQERQNDEYIPPSTAQQLQIGEILARGRYETSTNVKEILELSRDLAAMDNATDTTEIEFIYRNGNIGNSDNNHTSR